MKALLLTALTCLLLAVLPGCGGPSEDDVAEKAEEVVPRAQELILLASFSPEAECRDLAGEFAEEYEIDEMPYDDYEPKEAMTKLEKLEDGLDGLEEDLDRAGCNP